MITLKDAIYLEKIDEVKRILEENPPLIDEVDEDNQKMVLDIDGVYLTFELSALKRVINRAEPETVDPETTVIEEVTETEAVVEEAAEEVSTDAAIESKD